MAKAISETKSGDDGSASAALSMQGIHAGYGDVKVLKGVNIEVAAGEYVAIIGGNGHGKTTLLKTASGLLKPTSGKIYFAGQDITNYPAYKISEMGLIHIPEGSGLFPQMTVLENLFAGAFGKSSWGKRQKNLEKVYGLFPVLNERKNQLALYLSGGERRAASIARGLMADNLKLLMIDEPSAGLAPILIDEVYKKIAEIRKSKIGVVIVEQSPNWISDCDRIYLIENGEVKMHGTPKEVLESTEIRQAYLGASGG